MRLTGIVATIVYVTLYAGSVVYMDRLGSFPLEDALSILVVLGIGFSLLAWLVTIGVRPMEVAVKSPVAEALLTFVLLAGVVVYLVSVRSWWDGLVPDAAHGGSDFAHLASVVAGKLMVFVVLPYLLFDALFGLRWRDFGLSAESWTRLFGRDGVTAIVVGGALCAFQYFAGGAAAPFREGKFAAEVLWVGLPLSFVWLMIEVGLVEEFFFRAIVQQRLATLFRSDVAGLFVMALIFGLVHAPGMVLRDAGVVEGLGDHPTALAAAAYTIAVQSVAALMFGVVWLRTRNLLLLMLLHAAIDLLSNSADLFGTFGLIPHAV